MSTAISRDGRFSFATVQAWETGNLSNADAPTLTKYKIGFFIEWRLADRYKKERYDTFDYVLETEEKDHPKLVKGEAFRDGIRQFAREPFRLEPYFDPGIWGGHWMQENFGVGQEKENLPGALMEYQRKTASTCSLEISR